MRRGELLGLKWTDIDLDQGMLRIERGLSYVSNPRTNHYEFVEGEPKTATSKRQLRLPQVVVNALHEHKKRQLEQRASALEWEEKDLVFCNGRGSYINPNYLRVAFLSLLKKAGLGHMRLHDLRHSARTILRALGVDPIVIREILGWTSTSQVTDDVYGHSLPEMHEEAMDKLDSAFGEEE
jgi:integrase